jgi:DNA mismatch repair protein MSH2
MVEYFGTNSILRLELFGKLKRIPDLNKEVDKFALFSKGQKGAKLEHCVKLFYYSQTYLEILKLLEGTPYFYQSFLQYEQNSNNLVELVAKSIDMSSKNLESEYRINPSFDETLIKIHNDIQENERNIEELRQNASTELGLSNELKLVESGNYGLLFEGSKKEIHASIRDNPSLLYSIISHLQNNVKISCPALKRYSSTKTKLTESYLNSQVDLEHKVIELVAGYVPYITETVQLIAYLDSVLSLAHVSFSSGFLYCRPLFNDMGVLDIKACRHPCLEKITPCVPNDIKMEKNRTSFVVITGPNMGGKSTYLKQVALCMIISHIGCYVPAEYANLPVVTSVMARIGAGDNQLSGLSTFMSEMQEISKILEKATPSSFIIIDELGRGTSTSEGLGIAWAIGEYLSKLGCYTLFATHFSEITRLKCPNISNYYTDVAIAAESIEMKYKIIPGSIDFSFGIEIAQMAGIPENIINDAYEIKKIKEELEGQLTSQDEDSIIKFYKSL